MAMASSSPEAIPVKLQLPPSTPSSRPSKPRVVRPDNIAPDSIAGRALEALEDDSNDAPSSLDVHIRWIVESGSIVQRGERICQLFYSWNGAPPPSLGCTSVVTTNANSVIRARMKKKRWAAVAPTSGDDAASKGHQASAANAPSTVANNDADFVSCTIKANANGFLRILYTKSMASNAVQINEAASPKYSVLNLILAAIEPCEHPAVVGGLCAVCGADTRVPNDTCTPAGWDDQPVNQQQNQPAKPSMPGNRWKAPVDARQQQIIEKQKKLAASMSSTTTEFDDGNDDEFASFDMNGAIASHAKGLQQNPPAIATPAVPAIPAAAANAAAAPAQPKRTSAPTRSLSSLLSGAKATQKMQQSPPRHGKPPPTIQFKVRRMRPKPAAAASSTDAPSHDAKMSKVTVSGGVTITISESEAKNISDASSKKLREEKKLCLVLDLDHTLLHATDDYRAGRFVAGEVLVETDGDEDHGDDAEGNGKTKKKRRQCDEPKTRPNPEKRKDVRSILLPVELPLAQQQQYVQQKLQQQSQGDTHFHLSPLPQQNQKNSSQNHNNSIIMRHFIKLRPHLKEFFEKIQSTYQLSVYTAGTRSYAEQVAIMICRHLVGATLDEEDLNNLRARVREKEEQCRAYKAKIGRKKQLELAMNWANGDGNDDDKDDKDDVGLGGTKLDFGKESGSKRKAVRFGMTEEPDAAGDAGTKSKEKTKSILKKEKVDKKVGVIIKELDNLPAKVEDVANPNDAAEESKDVAVNDGVSAASKKRTHPAGDGNTSSIPRKKKNVNSGSLLTLLPTKAESSKKKDSAEDHTEEDVDPTTEKDRLLKELEEAEKLEVAAIELRRKMFGSRIVSRTDVGDLGKDVKSLKRVFPCGGVMAAILDDREDVWANAKNNVTGRPGEPPDNLLLVKPYHWRPFMGYADVNNASGNDLSKKGDDHRPASDKIDDQENDMQLLWTADILRRLHERYYSTALSKEERERATVPSLLQSMRKETLLRFPQVKVVFSGLIPINRQNVNTQIRPHVVRYAEELGAEVLPRVSEEVTHVVAARDGSEKIKQARTQVKGCYIVHTSWLMECWWSISRRDVRPHHMGPVPLLQHAKQQTGSKKKDTGSKERSKERSVLLSGSDPEQSSDDDSEDDFAADLEKEMMTEGKQ